MSKLRPDKTQRHPCYGLLMLEAAAVGSLAACQASVSYFEVSRVPDTAQMSTVELGELYLSLSETRSRQASTELRPLILRVEDLDAKWNYICVASELYLRLARAAGLDDSRVPELVRESGSGLNEMLGNMSSNAKVELEREMPEYEEILELLLLDICYAWIDLANLLSDNLLRSGTLDVQSWRDAYEAYQNAQDILQWITSISGESNNALLMQIKQELIERYSLFFTTAPDGILPQIIDFGLQENYLQMQELQLAQLKTTPPQSHNEWRAWLEVFLNTVPDDTILLSPLARTIYQGQLDPSTLESMRAKLIDDIINKTKWGNVLYTQEYVPLRLEYSNDSNGEGFNISLTRRNGTDQITFSLPRGYSFLRSVFLTTEEYQNIEAIELIDNNGMRLVVDLAGNVLSVYAQQYDDTGLSFWAYPTGTSVSDFCEGEAYVELEVNGLPLEVFARELIGRGGSAEISRLIMSLLGEIPTDVEVTEVMIAPCELPVYLMGNGKLVNLAERRLDLARNSISLPVDVIPLGSAVPILKKTRAGRFSLLPYMGFQFVVLGELPDGTQVVVPYLPQASKQLFSTWEQYRREHPFLSILWLMNLLTLNLQQIIEWPVSTQLDSSVASGLVMGDLEVIVDGLGNPAANADVLAIILGLRTMPDIPPDAMIQIGEKVMGLAKLLHLLGQ